MGGGQVVGIVFAMSCVVVFCYTQLSQPEISNPLNSNNVPIVDGEQLELQIHIHFTNDRTYTSAVVLLQRIVFDGVLKNMQCN